MGRRKKSSTKKVTKKKPSLSTVFTCPSCNNEKVVECSMDFKSGIGELECRICGAHFNTSIHRLSKPIDVYCDWIDEGNNNLSCRFACIDIRIKFVFHL